MTPELATILMFVVLMAGIVAGIPVASALGGAALITGWLMMGERVFVVLVSAVFGTMRDEIMIALPLFILMGTMLQASGIAERLFADVRVLLGPVRGGIGIVVVVVCVLLAATTGIIGTAVIMMGLLALPSMLKLGYNKPLATGIVCAAGSLGILIPPSILLILYGFFAGVSIPRLFVAAVIPGLLTAGLFVAYTGIRCYFQPHLGPPLPREERQKISLAIFCRLAASLVPFTALIFAVLGTIFLGIATPTEAAAGGALGSMIISARKLNWKALKGAATQALYATATVMWLLVGAVMFSAIFMKIGGGEVVTYFVFGLGGSPAAILAMLMLILFILGKFISWVGVLMIMVPIMTPLVIELGFDLVWFALLVCVNLTISNLTPPYAYAIFYLKQVSPPEVSLMDIYRGVVPFILLQIISLLLIIFFPQLVLWLPNLVM
ncbi:TRAP transporter large permease subunit [Dehalococcoidia bacterium]|nr:TRAP transporter large permease subunit [Dehalococcoidia bacterium]